jgi:hypothetical protein
MAVQSIALSPNFRRRLAHLPTARQMFRMLSGKQEKPTKVWLERTNTKLESGRHETEGGKSS